MNKKKGIAKTLAAFTAAGLLSCAMASAAFAAESYPVSTQLTPGAASTVVDGDSVKVDINVLDFEGEAGETVFLTVEVNGDMIAEYMPYVLGSDQSSNQVSAEGQSTVQSADVFAVELDKDDLAKSPKINVKVSYDRAGTKSKSFLVNWVYANLGDGKTELIGSCTEGAKFNAPDKIQVGNKVYMLKGQSSGASNSYDYEAYDPASTVDGVIRYVNASPGEGEESVLKYYTPIPGLKEGESRKVAIPTTVTEGGDIYSTLSFMTEVTAQHPGNTSFSIPVVKMGKSGSIVSRAVTIEMQADGKTIATDGVMVKNNVLYTAPSTIYKMQSVGVSGTQVFKYELTDKSKNPIELKPNGSPNAETKTIQYEQQALGTAAVEVTFNQVDGQERATSAARKLGFATMTVTGSDPVVTAEDVNLKTPEGYVLVGEASDYSYDLNSNKIPVVDVYYVPSGYQAPGSYNVTVNYVNFFDRSTIDSETFESKAEDVGDMQFTAPAQFSKNGVDWVRLGGQEEPISHNYYSQNKTYTVYYRDANQTLESAPTITQVRTIYQDQQVTTTTTTAGTTTTTTTAGAAAGTTATDANAATTATTLRDDTNYNVPNGQGVNPTATAQDGRTSVEERIDDDSVALSDGTTSATQTSQLPDWVIPVIVALAAVATACVAAFVVSRRRNGIDKA